MTVIDRLATERISYKSVAFNERFEALIERRGHREYFDSRAVGIEEARFLARKLRRVLGAVADDAALARVLAHNPEVLRVVDRGPERDSPFLAYLPLNAAGLDALTEGRLNRRDPDTALLCRANELPAALYIWCLYSPGSFIPAISAIAAHFQKIAPEGVPLFTSAANSPAARLFASLGFESAQDHYPRAAEDVLVVFRARRTAKRPAPPSRITTRVSRTIEDVMKVFTIRAAAYMHEQDCPYDEEFDGNDFCAAHILAEVNGEPAGCIRVRFFGDFVKIERLAVRHEFRGDGLAIRLARAAMDYARKKGFRRGYGHASRALIPFWTRLGYTAIPGRPSFIFSGIEYFEMVGDLDPPSEVVAIGLPPHILIRPEGAWDEPGPLDRSAGRGVDAAASRELRQASA